MQFLISAGQGVDIYRPEFAQILSRYKDFDSVILGCTELPMVIGSQETDLPIVNPIHAQCDAVLKFYNMNPCFTAQDYDGCAQ